MSLFITARAQIGDSPGLWGEEVLPSHKNSERTAAPMRPVVAGAIAPAAAEPTRSSSAFAGVLQSLANELGRGDAEVRTTFASLRAGMQMGPAELIALQDNVYRYSEAVELTSHLVDRTTGGIKTVLQGAGQ
jgi:hypothetical protein